MFSVSPGEILPRGRAGRGFPCSVAPCAVHNESPALADTATLCCARGKLETTLPFSFSLLEERRGEDAAELEPWPGLPQAPHVALGCCCVSARIVYKVLSFLDSRDGRTAGLEAVLMHVCTNPSITWPT